MTDSLMVKNSNVHLVIVTGQAQANLIPLLQFKPEIIVLAVSDDMKKIATEFEQLLNRTLPEAQIKAFDIPSANFTEIERAAETIDKALKDEFPHKHITYHATGGTKLMALAFYAVFAKNNNSVIYTDSFHHKIEVIYPRNQAAQPIGFALDTKTYLRSLGFNLHNSTSDNQTWIEPAKKRFSLTKWLVENVDNLGYFLGELNYLVDQAMDANKKRIVNPQQQLRKTPSEIEQTALEKLNELKLCDWSKNNPQLISFYHKVNYAKYLNGAWLEEYVWLVANDLGFNEVKANVRFSPLDSNTIENEIDCIALHNNRLLAIECKTGNLERDTRETNKILHKLDALSKGIGGLYHERWLVSARPVSEDTQQRAKTAKPEIKIVLPEQLKELESELIKWRDAKR